MQPCVGPSAGRQLIQHQIMSEQAAVMSPARPLPVRLQQDMKDEEMADADGHKPTAGTMGAMAISGTGPTGTLVICDVPGNLFSRRAGQCPAIITDSKQTAGRRNMGAAGGAGNHEQGGGATAGDTLRATGSGNQTLATKHQRLSINQSQAPPTEQSTTGGGGASLTLTKQPFFK